MSVVSDAESLVGKVSYVFGADDIENGVGDCSSFTQYVYEKNGYNIGRDTMTQRSRTTEVAKEDLQPGDLVFFQGTYRSGVSHVGIYIGNDEFIHNSSSGGVQKSSLNETYYQNHWLAGGRVEGVNTSSSDSSGGLIQTGISKIFDWQEVVTNVFVVVLIALLCIGGLVFFMGAWGVDINPLNAVNPLKKLGGK